MASTTETALPPLTLLDRITAQQPEDRDLVERAKAIVQADLRLLAGTQENKERDESEMQFILRELDGLGVFSPTTTAGELIQQYERNVEYKQNARVTNDFCSMLNKGSRFLGNGGPGRPSGSHASGRSCDLLIMVPLILNI